MKNNKFRRNLILTICAIVCFSLFFITYYVKTLTKEDKSILFSAFSKSTTVGPILPIAPNYVK